MNRRTALALLSATATAPFVLGSSDPVYYAWEGEGRLTFKKK